MTLAAGVLAFLAGAFAAGIAWLVHDRARSRREIERRVSQEHALSEAREAKRLEVEQVEATERARAVAIKQMAAAEMAELDRQAAERRAHPPTTEAEAEADSLRALEDSMDDETSDAFETHPGTGGMKP